MLLYNPVAYNCFQPLLLRPSVRIHRCPVRSSPIYPQGLLRVTSYIRFLVVIFSSFPRQPVPVHLSTQSLRTFLDFSSAFSLFRPTKALQSSPALSPLTTLPSSRRRSISRIRNLRLASVCQAQLSAYNHSFSPSFPTHTGAFHSTPHLTTFPSSPTVLPNPSPITQRSARSSPLRSPPTRPAARCQRVRIE